MALAGHNPHHVLPSVYMKKAPLTIVKNLLKEEKVIVRVTLSFKYIQKRLINLKTEEKFPSSSLGKNFPFG